MRLLRSLKWLGLVLVAVLQLLPCQAHAHFISPQRGTLNFVNGGGYMVLSVPVSAFAYVNDKANRDGKGRQLLSREAFVAHYQQMVADIEAHVQLFDDQGALQLEGTLLNFIPPDNDPQGAVAQLIVLGRFNLRQPDDINTKALRWRITLFGLAGDEQSFITSVSRVNPQSKQKESQAVVFSPESAERTLFPSAAVVLRDYVRLGMQHILSGFDHLLFLLVVLAAASGWRQVLLALTCFTLGHAITLSISLLGGVTVPAIVVEPTIALTIVGVALYDLWARRRNHLMPHILRLALVFACALVHGLGLASSLEALGLDRDHLVESLVGFNVGIELGQILVSLGVGAVVLALIRIGGAATVQKARALAGFVAIAVGGFWFVQRIVTL